MRVVFSILLVGSVCALPASAQFRPYVWLEAGMVPSTVHHRPQQVPLSREAADQRQLFLGGLIGGTVGLVGGGFLGGELSFVPCEDDAFCGLGEVIIGAIIGETIGTPVGAHLANDRRGNLGLSLLYAAGVTGAGWMLTRATDGPFLLAVPVVHLALSISVERATSRR